MRKPKDKDFLETPEGLLFCVVGYLHPPNAYTTYLKYRPAPKGRWEKHGVYYHRMLDAYSAAAMKGSTSWLRQAHPQYVSYDPVRGIELPLIPNDRVLHYYLPEVRMMELLGNPLDSLEKKVMKLVSYISEASGVPPSCLGITGSILLNIHNPKFSDIDLIVYGANAGRKIRDAIEQLYQIRKLHPFSLKEIQEWRNRQQITLEIPSSISSNLVWNRWQRGRIEGTPYSLHPTRLDSEIIEEYRQEKFQALGEVELIGIISDDTDSLFVPAHYNIEDVTIKHGKKDTPDISDLISFEGVFAGCVSQGDRVRVKGTLEKVTNITTGKIRYQVVIGTFLSRGWLIPLSK